MVLLLARVIGVSIETADMLVHEVLSGLDPSAYPVRVARRSVGARYRRSTKAKKLTDDIGLDKKPYKAPPAHRCARLAAVAPRCAGPSYRDNPQKGSLFHADPRSRSNPD